MSALLLTSHKLCVSGHTATGRPVSHVTSRVSPAGETASLSVPAAMLQTTYWDRSATPAVQTATTPMLESVVLATTTAILATVIIT